ncbi:hypothetical protein PY093_13905 [Cytobacillus sp. S13-E01]|uniref:hypothetical protein n=1 Tax=Cytobacillus sp. S13-E01 TaxID=3031326 RepID=UPI0023D7D365|nr:hypothetical protein [Cytobacillus sp. S13-E01]MDF0727769.1 hypothetical protein [Cytobacillus sp. S13-E01]
MNISEKLTQENFQDLLLKFYQKELESKEVEVIDVVNEIKKNILLICSSNN